MYSLDDYNYKLPQKLIAQRPVTQRDSSKLLCLCRETGRISHRRFYHLKELLLPSDVLVINNTEVVPGRLFGKKETGGKVEVLILDYAGACRRTTNQREVVLECLIKASKRLAVETALSFEGGLRAEVVDRRENVYTVKFFSDNGLETLLDRIGKVPLPPYIKRNQDDDDRNDRRFYQTVYASSRGAIAAPTAGLHFTQELLARIEQKGIRIVTITLHVGYGTFLPVRVDDIRSHKMYAEAYHIDPQSAAEINAAKAAGRRVVAVGTTCVRTLEYAAADGKTVSAGSGKCDLYIYPGYQFKIIDAMVTNFHLPKSTLLMLVSAFAGRQRILAAYHAAIEQGYRFYSYGDAMYIT